MSILPRPRKKRYRNAIHELSGYFAGDMKPEVWDQHPIQLTQIEPSIAAAKTALNAPFPDLLERPPSYLKARALIRVCVKWSEQLAQAFNADPRSTFPFGLQCHVTRSPSGKWASEYLGAMPSHFAHRVKPHLYSRFLNPYGEEPDYVDRYRSDLLGYWNEIAVELFWRHRADRASCRRVLKWVENALFEYRSEELPEIQYIRALPDCLHLLEVKICGVLMRVELQDNLVKLLWELLKGEPIAFDHRTFKQRLLDDIPSLTAWLDLAEPKKGESKEVTGSCYVLSKELIPKIDFRRYRPMAK